MGLAIVDRQQDGKLTRAQGFSLVEALVATVLVLMIAVGVLPMFTRATINNVSGIDYTRVTNEARSRGEQFHQLPFNSEPLRLLAGTDRVYDEYFALELDEWKDGTLADATSAGDTPMWTRTTTIRQFNIGDLTTPLDEAASPGNVHLKEIVVQVVPVSFGGVLGVRKQISVRILKAA